MVMKAHEWCKQNDFDFIITGEVVGQRPMSQRKDTMPLVCKRSGADDLLLRPSQPEIFLRHCQSEKAGWIAKNYWACPAEAENRK